MQAVPQDPHVVAGVIATLRRLLGEQHVLTDHAEREFYSQDVYRAGQLPAAVIRPGSVEELAAALQAIAPAGLHMARWFSIIESTQLVRMLRYSPFPVPETVVRQIVARVYKELAFHDRAGADPGIVDSFVDHIGTIDRSMGVLDIGRRLLPELEDPFDLGRIDCPLLLVWGEHDRMVYTDGAERVLRIVDYSDIEIIPACGRISSREFHVVPTELVSYDGSASASRCPHALRRASVARRRGMFDHRRLQNRFYRT